MSLDPQNALDVFFSYSHKDEELRDALETHLALLKREGLIRPWHDRRIGAGDEWESEIDANLESADIILLLISQHFIASDYCYAREMTRALELHEAGEARVIPIILRPCDWQSAPFGKLQGLPKDVRPITRWEDKDEAFLDVAQGLRSAIADRSPTSSRDELAEALDRAYEERAELEAKGEDIRGIDETIAGLKRAKSESHHLKDGDLLLDGRFKLKKLLGQGGFAEVWKAYDRARREVVAVKVLHGQYARDESRRRRFFRGARQMARLRHPGVVTVLEEHLRDCDHYFFVMEYVPGGDFRQAVLAGKLTIEERLGIILKVGEVLAFAHERGVIHRDVKPANILLDLDGRPKLTDFDLVHAADTTGGTRTSMLGTFIYAAPEAMMDGKMAAEPADVYGLGMTAIFALHGVDLPAVVMRKLPKFLASLEISAGCRSVLERAVELEIEDRLQAVGEFCDALKKARGRVNEKDGSVLVYVPGGQYTLGADNVHDASKPVHTVELSPFWIGETPVRTSSTADFSKLQVIGNRVIGRTAASTIPSSPSSASALRRPWRIARGRGSRFRRRPSGRQRHADRIGVAIRGATKPHEIAWPTMIVTKTAQHRFANTRRALVPTERSTRRAMSGNGASISGGRRPTHSATVREIRRRLVANKTTWPTVLFAAVPGDTRPSS